MHKLVPVKCKRELRKKFPQICIVVAMRNSLSNKTNNVVSPESVIVSSILKTRLYKFWLMRDFV